MQHATFNMQHATPMLWHSIDVALHQPNPISKVDVTKLKFLKDYFVCTFPKHLASIDISNKSLKHAFAPHFASNSCSC